MRINYITSSHGVVPINGETDEEIANQPDDKHQAVQPDQDPFVDRWENVSFDQIDVIVVRRAIVVGARFVTVNRHVRAGVGTIHASATIG